MAYLIGLAVDSKRGRADRDGGIARLTFQPSAGIPMLRLVGAGIAGIGLTLSDAAHHSGGLIGEFHRCDIVSAATAASP